MPIELMLLLVLIGAGTGSISVTIKVSPALIAIPALYFFLPVFGLSFDDFFLPIVASSLTAFIPTHLYGWVQSIKAEAVDFQSLINFTPGIVTGAVVGAQLLSLVSASIFKVVFSIVSIIAILNIILSAKIEKMQNVQITKLFQFPVGFLIGTVSLISGNCGRVLAAGLYGINKTSPAQRYGTIDGVAVFASIAAMVGFIYPAQVFDDLNWFGFAGAIHLPSVLVLAISHFFFYWLCHGRGSELDKKVLSASFVIFLIFALARLWI